MPAIDGRPIRPDLVDLWLPLLHDLTSRHPHWAVWKNPESAFNGPGDIDSMAPPSEWPAIEQVFRSWAVNIGLSKLIICRHVPQGPHFVAIEEGWPHLLILDVKKLSTWRGSTLVDYRHLTEVAVVEERGFRRIRAGAEGVVKLMLNGVLEGGRPNEEGLRTKGVEELLSADREGVEIAAGWFGPLSGAVLKGVDAYLAGGWDRRAMATVEGYAALRSLLEPRTAVSRLFFNHYTLKRCAILDASRDKDRRIPEDSEGWFRWAAENHRVEAIA